MTPTRNVDIEGHLADILLRSQAAWEEVRSYYKFDRHAHLFPEKIYFLLSHCAHLLFSLWLTEKESLADTFSFSASLDTPVSELDFEALRYVGYRRQIPQVNVYEAHLKNEPNWFKFWLKALQAREANRPLDADEFTGQVLTYVNNPGLLEGTVSRKDRKAFANLMKTDAGARLLHRSGLILGDMISAVVLQFTGLDPGFHATEQLAALVCMLRQVRLIIVNETPARGPYVLFSSKAWGEPALLRVRPGRTLGCLKVVPKRDGGGIACNYKWTSGSQTKKRSWTQPISALPHPYEETLFRTWPRDASKTLKHAGLSSEAEPCWLLQRAEARRLKTIFGHIEAVRKSLSDNPRCAGLLGDIADIFIDRHMGEQVSRLEWAYVDRLDQLLAKLQSAYREARILGGKNPGQEIIATMWPVQRSADRQVRLSDFPTSRSPRTPLLPRSVKWTETVPAKNHASRDQSTPAEQRPADTAVHAPVPHDSGSGTAQASMGSSIKGATQNHEAADGTRRAGNVCAMAQPNDHSIPKSAEENLPPMHQAGGPPCADGHPDSELSQEPQSEQSAHGAQLAVKSYQDEYQNKNVPIQCEVGGPPLNQDLPKGSESRDQAVGERIESEDKKPADSHSEPHVAKKIPDQVLYQCVTRQVHSSPEEIREIEDKDSTVQNGGAVTEPSASGAQLSQTPYQTYFQRLATKRTAPSLTACGSQISSTRLVLPKPRPNKKADQMSARRQLLTKLIEHHGSPTASGDRPPLSRKKMEEELGWKPSEVQRTMTDIFGNRPFAEYKQRCNEGTIGDFLDAWAQDTPNCQVAVSPGLVAKSI